MDEPFDISSSLWPGAVYLAQQGHRSALARLLRSQEPIPADVRELLAAVIEGSKKLPPKKRGPKSLKVTPIMRAYVVVQYNHLVRPRTGKHPGLGMRPKTAIISLMSDTGLGDATIRSIVGAERAKLKKLSARVSKNP
jgi:hypothetical protein